ncbi:MAG TPA: hypothetical protein VH417_16670 [Vicinamibacterales bacterium]|jgi:hypothetical protein
MTKYLAGVLSVIAVGVLLVAYGLLGSRASAFDPRADLDRVARPLPVGEQIALRDDAALARSVYVDRNGAPVYAAQPYTSQPAYASQPAIYAPSAAAPQFVSSVQPVQTVATAPVAPRRTSQTVERSNGRDWKKTALVIGGSSAAGAGLGGIFGGKKGALIGAAIGGGASALYETTKR